MLILLYFSLSFSPYAVSMWTMARHQVAAPWTRWPARAQASSCRPILSTANGESRSSTAPTATTTSRPSLCRETPPSPVTCECMMSFAFPWNFIWRKNNQMLPIVLKVFFLFWPLWATSQCHDWPDIKAATLIASIPVGGVHDQQLIVWCHIYS